MAVGWAVTVTVMVGVCDVDWIRFAVVCDVGTRRGVL